MLPAKAKMEVAVLCYNIIGLQVLDHEKYEEVIEYSMYQSGPVELKCRRIVVDMMKRCHCVVLSPSSHTHQFRHSFYFSMRPFLFCL